jgi:hypothetical protein
MADLSATQTSRKDRKRDYRDLKKHYVRVNGWLPIFDRHAKAKGSDLRYLTLCSKEAIDVRYFASKGMLARSDEKNAYPCLSFVESNVEDYAIIAETLGRCRLGVHARLEDVLLNYGHEEHAAFTGSFPYDIVNLDFCGEVMPKLDHPYSETVRCIERIVELQREKDPALEWHMFLTFRTHRVQHNEEANQQLREILDGNLASNDLKSAYGERADPGTLLSSDYPEFLRLGVAKYLAYCAERCRYRMTLESSWRYARHGGSYHMVKLVAGLRPLWKPQALPNPAQARQQYEAAVAEVFRSAATDVEAALADPAVSKDVQNELDLVISELRELRVVTD